MKKLMILLAALMMIVLASAFTTLDGGQGYYTKTVGAADTVSSAKTTWVDSFAVNKLQPLYYDVKVKVQDVDASGKGTIVLKGKKFINDVFTPIDTITYSGGGSDTTVIFTENSTKQFYNYYEVLITRTAGKLKVLDYKAFVKQ